MHQPSNEEKEVEEPQVWPNNAANGRWVGKPHGILIMWEVHNYPILDTGSAVRERKRERDEGRGREDVRREGGRSRKARRESND